MPAPNPAPYIVRVFAFKTAFDGIGFRYPTNYKTLRGARRSAIRAIERESYEGSVIVNALGERVARYEIADGAIKEAE